jgi:hypothetical protein
LSNIYATTLEFAQKLVDTEQKHGSIYENIKEIDSKTYIAWTNGVPSVHPSYLGVPSVEGLYYGEGVELRFNVIETPTEHNVRPCYAELFRPPDPISFLRVGLLLKERDENGDLLVYPMWNESVKFLQHPSEQRDLVITGMHYVMTEVFKFKYKQHQEE